MMIRHSSLHVCGTLLVLLLLTLAAGATVPFPLFHAAFDDGLDAFAGTNRVAAAPPGRGVGAPAPLVRGLVGRALLAGGTTNRADGAAARYDVSAFWPESRGTLRFWMRGEDLRVTWEGGFSLINLSGTNGWARLYKPGRHPWFGLLSRCRPPGAAKTVDGYLFFPGGVAYETDWRQWHLVAFTWLDDLARLYLDGVLVAETPGFRMPGGVSTLDVGSTRGEPIRFDDLAIDDRPLLAAELRRLWHERLRPLARQRVTVPLVRSAPVVDGRLAPGEWERAAGVAGLAAADGTAADDATRFSLQHDGSNLYVACFSPWPRAVSDSPHLTVGMTGLLKTGGTSRDADLGGDDHVAVMLTPAYPNGPCHWVSVNGADAIEDGRAARASAVRPDPGGTVWNLNAEARTAVSDTGWTVEMRLPLAELGTVTPGGTWGLNLARGWRALRQATNTWAWGHGWTEAPASNRVTDAGDPALLERLDPVRWMDVDRPVGELVWGTAESPVAELRRLGREDRQGVIEAAIRNPSRRDQELELRVATSSGEGNRTIKVALPPGGSTNLVHAAELINPATASLEFSVTLGNTPVARSEIRFHPEAALDMLTWSYPSRDTLRIKLDASLLAGSPPERYRAELAIRPAGAPAAAPPLVTRQLAAWDSHQPQFVIDTRDLPTGSYTVAVAVLEGAQRIATLEKPFVKKPLPPWLGNRIGISDRVPPPFTPLRRRRDTVSAWGRDIAFDRGLFPARIRSQGFDLLAAPIRVVLTDSRGAEVATTAERASRRWGGQTDTRVEGHRAVRSGPFEVGHDFRIEYDGLCWSRLTVSSPTREPLAGLRLEIPLRPEFGDVVNFGDYSLARTGSLPANGMREPFSRMVWLGNAYAGIMWVCDSQANWNLGKPSDPVIAIERGGDGVRLAITFVNAPTPLDKPLSIAFGLVATPVKGRVADYRRRAAGSSPLGWGYSWYPRGQDMTPGAEGWHTYRFIGTRPDAPPASSWWIRSTANRNLEKNYNGPYVATDCLNPRTPGFDDFFAEWMPDPDARFLAGASGGHGTVDVSTAPASYHDFFVWRYAELMARVPFAALYYDVSNGRGGANPFAGIGTEDRDGRLVPVFGYLGLREIARRLYTMVKERYPDAIIKYHNSGTPNLLFMAFADYFVDGENTFSRLNPNKRDYRGTLRPDVYRAQCMGHNYGFVTDFLAQLTRSGLWRMEELNRKENLPLTDHLIGLTLLHDTSLWDAYVGSLASERAAAALRRHDFSDAYKMIPYWEQTAATLPTNHYATFYVMPAVGAPPTPPVDQGGHYYRSVNGPAAKVIAIFCNESDAAGELAIPVDWSALGLAAPDGIDAENAVHAWTVPVRIRTDAKTRETDPMKVPDYQREFTRDPTETARVENSKLIFPMTPWNYRMIVLTPAATHP